MRVHAATVNDIHPPLFGATQRTFGLLRGLARGHAVEALCVVPNRSPAAAEEEVAGIVLHRRKAWYTSLAWRLERSGLAPMFVAAAWHGLRARPLAAAFREPADALFADLHLTGLFAADDAPLKAYAAHNVEYDHFRTADAPVLAPAFWSARMRDLEARAVAGAHLTVVCGEEDAARMRELYGAREDGLAVIPNGYDETRVRAPSPAERLRARQALGIGPGDYVGLFLGSNVPHNRAALAALITRVLPPLAGEGFRLIVAGSVARVLAGRREPWLVLRDESPDVSPVLHAADAGLNPVQVGGGSNVKVPTYLAAGLAVLTTPFGLRGYAPLRPWVDCVELDEMTAALRERPAGWHARGGTLPPGAAEYAWGRLGERLGEALAAARGGSVPAGDPRRTGR